MCCPSEIYMLTSYILYVTCLCCTIYICTVYRQYTTCNYDEIGMKISSAPVSWFLCDVRRLPGDEAELLGKVNYVLSGPRAQLQGEQLLLSLILQDVLQNQEYSVPTALGSRGHQHDLQSGQESLTTQWTRPSHSLFRFLSRQQEECHYRLTIRQMDQEITCLRSFLSSCSFFHCHST